MKTEEDKERIEQKVYCHISEDAIGGDKDSISYYILLGLDYKARGAEYN